MSELDYMNAIAGAANADEMATSTITQQWKATPLKAAGIIKAAATSEAVKEISGGEDEDKYTGPDLVRALAARFRDIIQAKNEGKEPPENPLIPGQKDSEAEVRADACILMGKARLTPPPPSTAPSTPTSPNATGMKLKPTKYTQGLTVLFPSSPQTRLSSFLYEHSRTT